MTKSDQVVTPPTAGPAADPALLGNAGATADAQEVGFSMAINVSDSGFIAGFVGIERNIFWEIRRDFRHVFRIQNPAQFSDNAKVWS